MTSSIINEVVVQTTTSIVNNGVMDNVVDNYDKINQSIEDHGIVISIIGLFVFVLMITIGYVLYSNKKATATVTDNTNKMLSTLLDMVQKANEVHTSAEPNQQPLVVDTNGNLVPERRGNKTSHERVVVKEVDIVKMFMNVQKPIKNILNWIRDMNKCSRVAIYVFHNGNFSSHGLPFFKVSCLNETISKNGGIPRVIGEHQNMPLVIYGECVETIYKYGSACIPDVTDILLNEDDEYIVFAGIMKKNGVTATNAIAIYDSDNNIVGLLLCDYNHPLTPEEVASSKEIMLSKAQILSAFIEYKEEVINNPDFEDYIE